MQHLYHQQKGPKVRGPHPHRAKSASNHLQVRVGQAATSVGSASAVRSAAKRYMQSILRCGFFGLVGAKKSCLKICWRSLGCYAAKHMFLDGVTLLQQLTCSSSSGSAKACGACPCCKICCSLFSPYAFFGPSPRALHSDLGGKAGLL